LIATFSLGGASRSDLDGRLGYCTGEGGIKGGIAEVRRRRDRFG
jgi:hypothetical protein